MSGFCNWPSTEDREAGIHRCSGGNRANPYREFQPCPCPCHLGEEEYECGGCGRTIREAVDWENDDDPGEPVYTHIDPETGRAIGEECA